MSKGGHNRKPKQLKIIQGTFRADRNPEHEPEIPPLSEYPKAPSYLNRWAKRKWKELVPQLVDTGILTGVDLGALELCCLQYGIVLELHDAITHYVNEDGKRTKRSIAQYLEGRTIQSQPEYSAMKEAARMYKALAEQFGITPASRSRVDIQGGEKEIDPMEALLDEG